MQALSVFFAISLFLGAVFMQTQHKQESNAAIGEATAIGGNMGVYRNAVVNYARANTGVTSSVADTALGLPTWFNHMPTIGNYVTGGKGYVYFSTATPELAYLILKQSNNSVLTGIKRSGVLYNPLSGTTSIALPAAIPDGSVVYADG
ncbi:hypothetical protein DFQ30_007202 [Apophysomyces sp. BC1015]|nr:hypothetical protein DFQ30_007202 [Apophysomyces sp. BC1015]